MSFKTPKDFAEYERMVNELQKINRSSFIQRILQDNTNKELQNIKNNLQRDLESLNKSIVMSGLQKDIVMNFYSEVLTGQIGKALTEDDIHEI